MKKRARGKKPAKTKAAVKPKVQKPARSAAKAVKAAKAATYTPTPTRGIGWAPFRYPLS